MFLNYLIKSLLDDVCSSSLTESLFRKVNGVLDFPFPFFYYDENGVRYDIFEEKETIVDLSVQNIYVRPWNNSKLINNLMHIESKEFAYMPDNHKSFYYSDIDLCYVYNGNHSINAGRYFKKGVIRSKTLNTTKLYPHCKTDGVHWYNSHTNEKLFKTDDFRLAAVYSIAKMRYEIIQNDYLHYDK